MERATRLNMDTLFEQKKQNNLLTLKTYNTVLERVHVRIKTASRQHLNSDTCWFVIPEILFGVPRYDVRACTAYILQQLEENGFVVKYTHPNLLFISWRHWVPDYVRSEFKQQTGIAIDGFGEKIEKKEEVKATALVKHDPKFKPTTSYAPTGRFTYDQELLNTIETKINI